MTESELREIVANAAADFGEEVAGRAVAAALSVRQGDDPHAYAAEVAEVVRRVVAASVAVRKADHRRDMEIQEAIIRALEQPVGLQRH